MHDVNPPPATLSPAVVPHVHVRVGGCDIAIPIEQVRQAVPLPPQGLTALPRRSGALLGVADVAGAAVPIVALERWLPLPTEGDEDTGAPRLLVLQHADALVGVRVDAVLGVKAVAAGGVRRVHHAPDDSELFESVVPASAAAPTLCLLEVARLMRLAQAWCSAAELAPPVSADVVAPAAQKPGCGTQRFAVFLIGRERWAVPVAAVQQVVPLPATELALGRNDRTWAIGQWRGRKLPLVDISEGRQANDRQTAPWMVLLGQGPLVLGLTVSACEQFVDLAPDAVARTPEDALLAGVILRPDLGKLQILDVDKLFGLTPGASISRIDPAVSGPRSGTLPSDATEPLPYLVFDADQRYATPVEGIVGVVEIPRQAQDDLRQGLRAILAWRDQTIRVVNLPAIARSAAPSDPLLAVLVQAPGSTSAPIGIAIRSLCDWLPAHSARLSGMRMGAMGELGLINAKGAVDDHANLVVVDLAQMAYLLG
ncbi:purine-binding chemotaxis protein CheW [Acidovorax sp. 69]|uniref:chemotaxis protein CheW n=1 Tax=Acidovorax sp. 69 TaxID=2035202 RepID=UPI000C23920D|nr:chemotaxis protein CheW [Acidovorax sp. 69]PJI99578.1 purine-binding chemotaxis protein CheW [Acidovorax sp. 69]